MTIRWSVLFFAAVVCVAPTSVLAQGNKDPHWGVTGSFTSDWTIAGSLRDLLFEDEGTIKGSEFTIGFVKGSTRGGDWGVSFVRKPWDDGSGPIDHNQQCYGQNGTVCATEIESTLTQGVNLNGVEVHWFIPFATIKNHLQLGANLAVGAAKLTGDVVKTTDGFNPVFTPPNNVSLVPTHEVETIPAEEELFPYFPLAKAEVVAALILVPSLKVQFAYGANFPAYSFRFGVVYLFGAK